MIRAATVLVSLALAGCSLFGGNVFDLAVGDCFNDAGLAEGATEVADVPIVECDDLHDYEVFAAFDMTDESYPGAAATQQAALDGCLERFEGFVGLAYEDSVLDVTYLYPTQQTWDDGDREIVCAIYRLDGAQVTGTLQGSSQ